ncbi:MAG: flagellar hook-associated protein 3 [bacterium]|nr:flagellar hook-associated protein 3 [bacterium]
MNLRSTQGSVFRQVRSGIQLNLGRVSRAQQEVATGKRILRPSDDPVGTSYAIALRRQIASIESYKTAVDRSRPVIDTASSQLQEASNMVADARALIIQGMNGTLSQADRDTLAQQLELTFDGLLSVVNSRWEDRYLFSGTATGTEPFQVETVNGQRRVVYAGDDGSQSVAIGRNVEIDVNTPGSTIFGRFDYSGTTYQGMTGIQSGTSADSGSGYSQLTLRHDATTGTPGAGIALVQMGDTILGDHDLVVDGTLGTVQLGAGSPVSIPSPLPADLVVRDSDGSEVHLDLTGWTGADVTATLTGEGSISLDGGTFQPIDGTETDLELIDPQIGTVLHVDTTGVTRAGGELVTFGGTTNIFDTLLGAAADLRNADGLLQSEIVERLNHRITELDSNFDSLQIANGNLGSRAARLQLTDDRLGDLSVQLEGILSGVEDADLTDAVLEMTRAEQTLEVAQATGARLIQQSLLNYLR